MKPLLYEYVLFLGPCTHPHLTPAWVHSLSFFLCDHYLGGPNFDGSNHNFLPYPVCNHTPKPGRGSLSQLHAEHFLSPDSVPLLDQFQFDHNVCKFVHSMRPLAVHVHSAVVPSLCCM